MSIDSQFLSFSNHNKTAFIGNNQNHIAQNHIAQNHIAHTSNRLNYSGKLRQWVAEVNKNWLSPAAKFEVLSKKVTALLRKPSSTGSIAKEQTKRRPLVKIITGLSIATLMFAVWRGASSSSAEPKIIAGTKKNPEGTSQRNLTNSSLTLSQCSVSDLDSLNVTHSQVLPGLLDKVNISLSHGRQANLIEKSAFEALQPQQEPERSGVFQNATLSQNDAVFSQNATLSQNSTLSCALKTEEIFKGSLKPMAPMEPLKPLILNSTSDSIQCDHSLDLIDEGEAEETEKLLEGLKQMGKNELDKFRRNMHKLPKGQIIQLGKKLGQLTQEQCSIFFFGMLGDTFESVVNKIELFEVSDIVNLVHEKKLIGLPLMVLPEKVKEKLNFKLLNLEQKQNIYNPKDVDYRSFKTVKVDDLNADLESGEFKLYKNLITGSMFHDKQLKKLKVEHFTSWQFQNIFLNGDEKKIAILSVDQLKAAFDAKLIHDSHIESFATETQKAGWKKLWAGEAERFFDDLKKMEKDELQEFVKKVEEMPRVITKELGKKLRELTQEQCSSFFEISQDPWNYDIRSRFMLFEVSDIVNLVYENKLAGISLMQLPKSVKEKLQFKDLTSEQKELIYHLNGTPHFEYGYNSPGVITLDIEVVKEAFKAGEFKKYNEIARWHFSEDQLKALEIKDLTSNQFYRLYCFSETKFHLLSASQLQEAKEAGFLTEYCLNYATEAQKAILRELGVG